MNTTDPRPRPATAQVEVLSPDGVMLVFATPRAYEWWALTGEATYVEARVATAAERALAPDTPRLY